MVTPLPMSLADCEESAINPALVLLGPRFDSVPLRALMMSIALQESALAHRQQVGGPARGLWQFEMGGGVRGVLRHPSTSQHAQRLCASRGVICDAPTIYGMLDKDDILAAGIARLLLWTDPKALPGPKDVDAGWDYYQRNWRPGKPHPEKWAGNYRRAWQYMGAA